MRRRVSARERAARGPQTRPEPQDRTPGPGTRRSRPAPRGLEAHCARWTGPRDEVFNILAGTQEHLSATDVFARLRAGSPEIGLTTVYRTIELLESAGLVRRVQGHGSETRFEYRRGDREDHHHHLICTACGRIINYRDFETEELSLVQRTEERLARKHGFLIRDHNIEFLGLCSECRPGGPRSLLQTAGRSRSRRSQAAPGSSSPRKNSP